MFKITQEKIDSQKNLEILENQSAGAAVVFEGRVRDNHLGKQVSALSYEAYDAVCENEFAKIEQEALEKFEILEISCVHRVGDLDLGDAAIWLGVLSAHRRAGYEASAYIMSELKQRLPIWKKEHYLDFESAWVDARCECVSKTQVAKHKNYEPDYAQQINLKEIGEFGQEKIKNSKILIIGLGGLGTVAAEYLARAGVGEMGLCDFDAVNNSNLARQILYYPEDLSKLKNKKINLAKERLEKINPNLKIDLISERISGADNWPGVFKNYDLILDCTDNFEAKMAINNASYFSKVPVVRASIYQYEGQLEFYDPNRGDACLRCLWGNNLEKAASCVQNCNEAGVLGMTVGALGSLQALEAIKYISKFSIMPQNQTIFMNLLDYSVNKIKRAKDPDCKLCSNRRKVLYA